MDGTFIVFDDLVRCVIEGEATDEEFHDLVALMRDDPGLQTRYCEQVYIHALLTCHKGQEWPAEEGLICASDTPKTGWQRFRARKAWAEIGWRLAAALLGLSLVGVWTLLRMDAPSHADRVTLRASCQARWADGREVTVGIVLKPGGIWTWQSGLVELVTGSGTVLLVEAPASLEFKDALHARLFEGKLVARMPKGGSGFVIETPNMRVRDLGTEFGVSVSSAGETQVQVFDGKVCAETAAEAQGKEFLAGEAIRSTSSGGMVAAVYDEKRFIRRFPPVINAPRPSGVLYSQSVVETVRVAYAQKAVLADGILEEWDKRFAFRSGCQPPYAGTYFLEGMMMYDAENLYLAAQVGDPDPLCNRASTGLEFAGGSVIVRVSTDAAQGWPLKGSLVNDGLDNYVAKSLPEETQSDLMTSIIMWHDAQANRARIKLTRGLDSHDPLIDPPGWQGTFRKTAGGQGYTLEYVIPWRLLNSSERPPKAGDTLAALWMIHWSDAEGRVARGQLVEVTNHQPHPGQELPPYVFYRNGPSWGKALYLSKEESNPAHHLYKSKMMMENR